MDNTLAATSNHILRVNVGFLLKEGPGYSRDISFSEAALQVAPDLLTSDFQGVVNLTRTPQGLYAQGRLKATVDAECARCLEPTLQPVACRLGDLFFFPPQTAPEGALVVGEDAFLDLTPLVREDMLLSIPIQALCRPDCRGLCPHCGQNWNEGPCDCKEEAVDPRLAVLRDLLKELPE